MKYQIRLEPKAQKELKRLPVKYRLRINIVLAKLRDNPFIGKKLRGKRRGYLSVRVWPYRLIYLVRKRQLLVLIVRITHRQGVYK